MPPDGISFLACTVVCCVTLNGNGTGSAAELGEPDDRRHAWRYVDRDETVTFVEVKDKEWVVQRQDGRTNVYDELERTDEAIELRHRVSKLHIRLQRDVAYWRKDSDTDWKRWFKGQWVDRPDAASEKATTSDKPSVPASNSPAERTSAADYRLRLAYFIPQDRQPIPHYADKIQTVVSVVSELYRTDLRAKGHVNAGFRWETEDERPLIRVIPGERPAAYYNGAPNYDADEQWKRLLPEIREKVGDPHRQLMLVFVETWDDGPAEHYWPGIIARGAYYSADGGLAVCSAHILQDGFGARTVDEQRSLFFDKTPVPHRKAHGHPLNTPRGEFVEDGIGALAHELGHALGLPHDHRNDDQDLMGNGFRNLRWNFAPPAERGKRVGFSEDNLRLLASSRYISPDLDLTDKDPPSVTLKFVTARDRTQSLSVSLTDNKALRAITFVDDNAGGIFSGRKLKGTSQEFQLPLPATVFRKGNCKLTAIVSDEGGNQRREKVTSGTGAVGSK